jgi:hypothetical protein
MDAILATPVDGSWLSNHKFVHMLLAVVGDKPNDSGVTISAAVVRDIVRRLEAGR